MKSSSKSPLKPIIKKSASYKPKRSIKNIKEILLLSILVFEAGKMLLLKGLQSENYIPILIESLVSILLFLGSFFLERFFLKKSLLKSRILKELCLISCMILFLLALQTSYFQTQVFGEDVLTTASGSIALHGMFAVCLVITQILNMKVFSQLFIVSAYFIYLLVQSLKPSDQNLAESIVKILTPWVHLMIVLFLVTKKKVEKKAPDHTIPKSPLFQMIEETIVTCSPEGNIQLVNQFCLKYFDFRNPTQLMERITNLKIYQEEGSRTSSLTNLNEKKFVRKKTIDPKEDPLANLGNLFNSTLASITKKEITEQQVTNYTALFQGGELGNNYLQIKVFALAHPQYPVIAVLKNDTYRVHLEEFRVFEQVRNGMMTNFYNELKHLIELSKLILINYYQPTESDLSSVTSTERRSEDLVQPLLITVGVLTQIVDDNIGMYLDGLKELPFQVTKCNIKSVLIDVISLFRGYAISKNVNLEFRLPDNFNDYMIHTDPERLAQLSVQLIYNALKYTQNHTVTIVLSQRQRIFKVKICDPGSQIPEKELHQIQNDLNNSEPNFLKIFYDNQKNRELRVANVLAKGLAGKAKTGLGIQSRNHSGTDVWFFVEDQTEPPSDVRLMKSKRSSDSSQFGNFTPARPSIFKPGNNYPSKDTTDSYIVMDESIEVGSVNIPSLSKILQRGSFLQQRSTTNGSYGVKGSINENEIMRRSKSPQFIVKEISGDMLVPDREIVVVSQDYKEISNLTMLLTEEKYHCVNAGDWKDLEIEMGRKREKIVIIMIDLESISKSNTLVQIQQVIKKGNQNYKTLPTIIGFSKKDFIVDRGFKDQTLFIQRFFSKPFNKAKVLQLVRNIS